MNTFIEMMVDPSPLYLYLLLVGSTETSLKYLMKSFTEVSVEKVGTRDLCNFEQRDMQSLMSGKPTGRVMLGLAETVNIYILGKNSSVDSESDVLHNSSDVMLYFCITPLKFHFIVFHSK